MARQLATPQKAALVCGRWGADGSSADLGYGSDLGAAFTPLPVLPGAGAGIVPVGAGAVLGGAGKPATMIAAA
jgi:hypothetical protein